MENAPNTTETPTFEGLLEERRVLIADGATGTNYQSMGMEPGLAPEEWLFQAPDRVLELHRTAVGPVHLGPLAEGRWRPLTSREVRSLRRDD